MLSSADYPERPQSSHHGCATGAANLPAQTPDGRQRRADASMLARISAITRTGILLCSSVSPRKNGPRSAAESGEKTVKERIASIRPLQPKCCRAIATIRSLLPRSRNRVPSFSTAEASFCSDENTIKGRAPQLNPSAHPPWAITTLTSFTAIPYVPDHEYKFQGDAEPAL
jgi:hypothetical protein